MVLRCVNSIFFFDNSLEPAFSLKDLLCYESYPLKLFWQMSRTGLLMTTMMFLAECKEALSIAHDCLTVNSDLKLVSKKNNSLVSCVF